MAQLFLDKDYLDSDPIQSSKQFVITLEDNIGFRGAMNKSISDYAQVEISKKGQDILRMYHSSSGHSEPSYQNQILLNGGIGSSRLGPTPSLFDLEHLHTASCPAYAMLLSTLSYLL